jgi:hypothetical protein
MMNAEMLAEWHREQAKKVRHNVSWRAGEKGEESLKARFHLDAARLIESFSEKHQQARLAETEREVKVRAIESLESLAKAVLVESKDFRKMLASVVDDSN